MLAKVLVLAVATETLVFITVLLQNKDGMEVTASQIKPNLSDQPHHPTKADFLVDLLYQLRSLKTTLDKQ